MQWWLAVLCSVQVHQMFAVKELSGRKVSKSLVARLVFVLMMTSSFDYAMCLGLGLLETHLSNFSCGDY